jgi:hypothetical protein
VRRRNPPWNSYDATTTASVSRSARSPSPRARRVAERAPDESEHRPEALGREEHRLVGRARCADGAAGPREVPDERVGSAALDAALEVRHVPGEPKELQLEREREWIEPGAAAQAGGDRVHRGEEPRQSLERALVPLLLDEQPEHRLGADEPDREAIRSSRVGRCASTSETPVTVCNSPPPWWSRSSTCEKGSRRAPKRDFVFRTPFAIAPMRPRSAE